MIIYDSLFYYVCVQSLYLGEGEVGRKLEAGEEHMEGEEEVPQMLNWTDVALALQLINK